MYRYLNFLFNFLGIREEIEVQGTIRKYECDEIE
jgi:hypothetical protein